LNSDAQSVFSEKQELEHCASDAEELADYSGQVAAPRQSLTVIEFGIDGFIMDADVMS
jgi:hypothetical protein